jgi:hypothetical protein
VILKILMNSALKLIACNHSKINNRPTNKKYERR